jgi:hypothetical protein
VDQPAGLDPEHRDEARPAALADASRDHVEDRRTGHGDEGQAREREDSQGGQIGHGHDRRTAHPRSIRTRLPRTINGGLMTADEWIAAFASEVGARAPDEDTVGELLELAAAAGGGSG